MTTIEFQATAKYSTVSIKGCMNLEDADGESPLQFYTETNELQWRVPENPYIEHSPNYEEYELLRKSIDEDELFIQWLVDFAEESKTVDRGTYILRINGGDDL